MFEDDKKLLGEVLLIVGGFIFAETIVRFFLKLSEEAKIALWILPAIAILLIIDGFQLKNNIKEKSYSSWAFDGFIIIELILVVLLKSNYLSAEPFLWITLVGSIVILLFWIIESAIKKFPTNRKKTKKPIIEKKISPVFTKEVVSLDKNNELLRLAIITLLVAGMFGILQYFPEGIKFESLETGMILKVVASTMLYATFPIFALYLALLGLDCRYKKRQIFGKLRAFFYDLGICLTIVVILFTTLLYFLIWLLVKMPAFPMGIVVGIIWVFIVIISFLIWNSLRMHLINID